MKKTETITEVATNNHAQYDSIITKICDNETLAKAYTPEGGARGSYLDVKKNNGAYFTLSGVGRFEVWDNLDKSRPNIRFKFSKAFTEKLDRRYIDEKFGKRATCKPLKAKSSSVSGATYYVQCYDMEALKYVAKEAEHIFLLLEKEQKSKATKKATKKSAQGAQVA